MFAPSDDAFVELPQGTVETLVKPESKVQLLKLHVLPGKVMATDIAGKTLTPKSADGKELHIDGTHGGTVNGAEVTIANIECSNGVIHVIDTVLMPKG